MAILKSALQTPVLPEPKVVSVPELGGEVIVMPLTLSDRLAMANKHRADNGAAKDYAHIATLLSYVVVDDNHEPLFSAQEWEAWGAMHTAAALTLWNAAYEISGLDSIEEAEKN